MVPSDMGGGDISGAIGADRHHMVIGEATSEVEKSGRFAKNGGGNELVGRAIDDPE